MRRAARLGGGLLAVLGVTAGAAGDPGPAAVLVHEGGRARALPLDLPEVQALVERCEARLQASTDRLKLAVTPELVEGLRRRELAVEVHYPAPRAFLVGPRRERVTAARLLVPLSGELAEGATTIFYGERAYAPGPFRAPGAPADIAEALAAARTRAGP